MKTSINIATYPSREECLTKMLASVRGRFDEVRVYVNDHKKYELTPNQIKSLGATVVSTGKNRTDNGKFYWLEKGMEDEYYFTADDDIAYHSTYCEDMVKHIDHYNCIITHHGRIILGENRDYYRENKMYSCLSLQNKLQVIDVAGTGGTAFNTKHFNPYTLKDNPKLKMSDLIFSLEAAKQGVDIMVVPHTSTYFTYLKPELNGGKTIHSEARKLPKGIDVQNRIANEIFRILR